MTPPGVMPAQLVAYARGPYLAAAPAQEAEATELPPEPMQKICAAARADRPRLLGLQGHHHSPAHRAPDDLHQIKGPTQ